jgi:tetratricopeptide (TPR) repeat protein
MSGIFLSYRRDDSASDAGRIGDHLIHHFGTEQVFVDIDTIPPGEDFLRILENNIARCDVLVAVIGKQWLNSTDRAGRRRLHNSDDFVRLEITAALKRNIPVFPVLVGEATLPPPEELPDDLAPLVRRQAIEVRLVGFRQDVEHLIRSIEANRLKRVQQLLSDARKAFESGDNGDAIAQWQEALSISPNALGAAESIEAAKKAEREGQIEKLKGEARQALHSGQYPAAEQAARKALQFAGDDPDLRSLLQSAQAGLRVDEEERKRLFRVEELTARGQELFHSHQYAAAEVVWGEALKLSPGNVQLTALISRAQQRSRKSARTKDRAGTAES